MYSSLEQQSGVKGETKLDIVPDSPSLGLEIDESSCNLELRQCLGTTTDSVIR